MNDQSTQVPPGKFVGFGVSSNASTEARPAPPADTGFPVWGIVTIALVALVAIVAVLMKVGKKSATVA